MGLNKQQESEVKNLVVGKIREKLQTYSRETSYMPFHTRLFGEERMATYSFIQSCNTMLGQSIFEKVGEIIAKPNFKVAIAQHKFIGTISNKEVLAIENILKDLKAGKRTSNKEKEVSEILKAKNKGKEEKTTVDLYLEDKKGKKYLLELKTAKPNISEFVEVKRKLLRWVALTKEEINSSVCIVYNPYYPVPYERWTLQGLFDLNKEVLVEAEFWDFLGGKGTFEKLLEIFKESGKELSPEIEKKIKELSK